MTNVREVTALALVNHSRRIPGAEHLRLVNLATIYAPTLQNKYAVSAINIRSFPLPKDGSYEKGYVGPSTVVAAMKAAMKAKAPLVLEIAETEYEYVGPQKWAAEHGFANGFEMIMAHVKAAAKEIGFDLPLAVHFDHGKTEEYMKQAVAAGFTSIAMDGGDQADWNALVSKARSWVEYCHQRGVTVEGEIETVGAENPTEPAEAIQFYNETGVDVVVVTLPKNEHGADKGKSVLDQARLLEVRRALPVTVPVNLHGGSGFSDDDLRAAVDAGAAQKVNYATNVAKAMFAASPAALEALNQAAGTVGKSAKDARKSIYKLADYYRKMGAEEVARMEGAGEKEIYALMLTLRTDNTARFYS